MSPYPSTGTPRIFEDGDERNYSREAIHKEQRHHLQNVEGYMKKNQHKGMNDMITEDIQAQIQERYKSDPLFRATMNGNQPSKGAKQDAEIQAEEAEMLRRKKEKADGIAGKKLESKSAREH
ncbi:hypothetical protein F5Y14DRAFT_4293 [Nemania sp. NC0429]|nr:hypothetical protein F5Y14DRAFT_4293 [Nemania sp. NC0429]